MWKLTYEAKFIKGTNKVEVTIYLDDPRHEVREIYLRTSPSGPFQVPEDYITNLRSEGGTVSTNSWNVEGVGQARLLYTANLNVEYAGGGYSSFASSEWVVTAGDLLFITSGWGGTYDFPQVILRLSTPSEWVTHTPYPETGSQTYDATGIIGHITPRDFIVVGSPDCFNVATIETAAAEFTAVTVKPSAMAAQEVVDYVSRVGAEYAKIAGCMPPHILIVIAPEPMRRHGGEGKDISIFASDDNPFPFDLSWGSSTYAHELFHLYQKYYTEETWIGEGVATYYQFYGPLKAGYMAAEDFWRVMVEVLSGRADKGALLSSGQDPYFKGALITLALDIKMRQDSVGMANFDDVLRTLNTDFGSKYVSSHVLRLIIFSLTASDYRDFFDKYVQGSEYPGELFAATRDSYLSFLEQ